MSTPGPWHVGGRSQSGYIFDSNGDAVVQTVRLEDVALIAAAPELKLAVQYLLTIINRNEPRLNGMMEVDFARAVLAKVES